MSKNYKILSQTEPRDSEKELTIEVAVDFIDSFIEKTIADFTKEVEVDGFRKGHAPVSTVKERVGNFKIFEESAQRAIQAIIPIVLSEEKLDAITMPHVHLSKITPEQPVEFKMHFFVMPEVTLADYKKCAQAVKKEKAELKQEEIDGYIEQILQSRATKDEKEKESKPELTDDFVKTLGEFTTVDDFKTKLSENMKADKETQVNQKRRLDIMESIIKETKIKLPEVLVEEEQNKMLEEFKGRVESMKMNFEEYLTTIKKTEDELKKEWHADATKRARMNVILPQIAQVEDLKPDQKDIDHEVEHLKEHHPDIDENKARVYLAGILTNEKVFKFLETL